MHEPLTDIINLQNGAMERPNIHSVKVDVGIIIRVSLPKHYI